MLVFVVVSIVEEEEGSGVVLAKKHVYREYITIKSHPMDDCRWKSTLSFLIRIQELFRLFYEYLNMANKCMHSKQTIFLDLPVHWSVVSHVILFQLKF